MHSHACFFFFSPLISLFLVFRCVPILFFLKLQRFINDHRAARRQNQTQVERTTHD